MQVTARSSKYSSSVNRNSDGPIATLKVGGQNLILLNDESVIKDLLERHSNIYSPQSDLFIHEFGEIMNTVFLEWDLLE